MTEIVPDPSSLDEDLIAEARLSETLGGDRGAVDRSLIRRLRIRLRELVDLVSQLEKTIDQAQAIVGRHIQDQMVSGLAGFVKAPDPGQKCEVCCENTRRYVECGMSGHPSAHFVHVDCLGQWLHG